MSKFLLRSKRNRLPAPREANQIKQSGKEDSLFINLTRSPGDLHSRLEILLQLLLDASRTLLALPRTPPAARASPRALAPRTAPLLSSAPRAGAEASLPPPPCRGMQRAGSPRRDPAQPPPGPRRRPRRPAGPAPCSGAGTSRPRALPSASQGATCNRLVPPLGTARHPAAQLQSGGFFPS